MPPLRSGRASKACDLCRKNKTRCYAKDGAGNTCLRCHTLSLPCSLRDFPNNGLSGSPYERLHRRGVSPQRRSPEQPSSTDARLERLERTVGVLVERLDSQLKDARSASETAVQPPSGDPRALSEPNPAPVILIRDAANDAGVAYSGQNESHASMVSSPLWTMGEILRRCLDGCSFGSIRHTTQELAAELAPRLFREAKRLISISLLEIPQTIEHFQATLILSLWSTTIGQVPLSIDSWLLTGYALQQGSASSCFPEIPIDFSTRGLHKSQIDAWCLWNHLCVAHLQYCVGTRRETVLTQSHIDRCRIFLESGNLENYEARMVAEVKLYWVIYEKCCGRRIDLAEAKLALQSWKDQWASLFDEPRSQFLQMGFHFAHFLAYYQSVRSPERLMDGSAIMEMIDLSRTIINLAIDTTDDRTRHLTDHIYHVVTFSALTLCRLTSTYDAQLRVAGIDVNGLDRLVIKLIAWLRSIGLPCHAAHLLSETVATQFKILRPGSEAMLANLACYSERDYNVLPAIEASPLTSNIGVFYPDLIGSELFYMDDGTASWPQWS
ncbi:hypothetical protein N7532_002825 [Penicillium argentinense]|uniref:Transcriptional activator of proteases prtT n=1 Tax=Penicillium argentinense TaxID=1131581 RepID=A0A9W9G210_9EURO|nr:uncharacterized protein N7532_002825 [Penicillium argentinense]KAJ5110180.1 hypothetical protein N7532_002825 [Penicillium argentinense]